MTILWALYVFRNWRKLDSYSNDVIFALIAFPIFLDSVILALIFSQ